MPRIRKASRHQPARGDQVPVLGPHALVANPAHPGNDDLLPQWLVLTLRGRGCPEFCGNYD